MPPALTPACPSLHTPAHLQPGHVKLSDRTATDQVVRVFWQGIGLHMLES